MDGGGKALIPQREDGSRLDDQVRKQLKSIGCVWDKDRKAWVAFGRHPRKENIPSSGKWAGLEAYINRVEYRVRMGGSR